MRLIRRSTRSSSGASPRLGRIQSTRDLISPEALTALVLLGALALIAVAVRSAVSNRR
jgi:hypothetical protein